MQYYRSPITIKVHRISSTDTCHYRITIIKNDQPETSANLKELAHSWLCRNSNIQEASTSTNCDPKHPIFAKDSDTMYTYLNKHKNLIKINFNRNNKKNNKLYACLQNLRFYRHALKNILLPIDKEINHITENRNNHQVLLCKLIILLASESLALSLMITSFCCSTCSSKC